MELASPNIDTPADLSRAESYTDNQGWKHAHPTSASNSRGTSRSIQPGSAIDNVDEDVPGRPVHVSSSSPKTAVPTHDEKASLEETKIEHAKEARRESVISLSSASISSSSDDQDGFVAVPTTPMSTRPRLRVQITEDDLFRCLSKRKTIAIHRSETDGTTSGSDDEQEEIDKLLSRMFGHTRQAASEEEKTRHLGVVFQNLTVKGMGLGAALQPAFGEISLGLPRLINNLVTRGPQKTVREPLMRTIIDDFSGCIKPGEMLLVLGRPGAGCSTFLKVLGNQRFGYEEITGDVEYGGTGADEMRKKFRSEVLYNPEDDFHCATLKVKDTLRFALNTKTPGKASRCEGESRRDYVHEFLRVVSKLFWIEHTMDTKVGNELIRGVSGGEKKRISIAEAMITKVKASGLLTSM